MSFSIHRYSIEQIVTIKLSSQKHLSTHKYKQKRATHTHTIVLLEVKNHSNFKHSPNSILFSLGHKNQMRNGHGITQLKIATQENQYTTSGGKRKEFTLVENESKAKE